MRCNSSTPDMKHLSIDLHNSADHKSACNIKSTIAQFSKGFHELPLVELAWDSKQTIKQFCELIDKNQETLQTVILSGCRFISPAEWKSIFNTLEACSTLFHIDLTNTDWNAASNLRTPGLPELIATKPIRSLRVAVPQKYVIEKNPIDQKNFKAFEKELEKTIEHSSIQHIEITYYDQESLDYEPLPKKILAQCTQIFSTARNNAHTFLGKLDQEIQSADQPVTVNLNYLMQYQKVEGKIDSVFSRLWDVLLKNSEKISVIICDNTFSQAGGIGESIHDYDDYVDNYLADHHSLFDQLQENIFSCLHLFPHLRLLQCRFEPIANQFLWQPCWSTLITRTPPPLFLIAAKQIWETPTPQQKITATDHHYWIEMLDRSLQLIYTSKLTCRQAASRYSAANKKNPPDNKELRNAHFELKHLANEGQPEAQLLYAAILAEDVKAYQPALSYFLLAAKQHNSRAIALILALGFRDKLTFIQQNNFTRILLDTCLRYLCFHKEHKALQKTHRLITPVDEKKQDEITCCWTKKKLTPYRKLIDKTLQSLKQQEEKKEKELDTKNSEQFNRLATNIFSWYSVYLENKNTADQKALQADHDRLINLFNKSRR